MELSASESPDRFPTYNDGDVKIVITASRQYTLHATVLENNSSVLRELLRSVGRAPLNPKAVRNGATIAYRLVLVGNEYEEPAVDYILEPVQLAANGRPVHGDPMGVGHDFEHGKVFPSVFTAYDSVLGAFYNVPIRIGDSQDDPLNHLLSVALDITTVAEYLNCVHIITTPIEACLQATGQNLYKAISGNPTAWLSFASRVRSKVIFREALVHATGQFNTPGLQRAIRNGDMAEDVVRVLRRKGNALIGYVKMAERHFASYYPTVLMRQKTVGSVDRDNIGRANYGNDIIMWIALCVFRHWCADQMAADQTHHAADGGYQFIKAVQEGGNAYLSRTLMQAQFHQRFPMSPKGMACVEHRLSEIKENVKQWAMPLMHNAAHLDVKRWPVKYFTSTHVNHKDYPWEAKFKRYDDQDASSNEDDQHEPMADVEGFTPLHALAAPPMLPGDVYAKLSDLDDMEGDFSGEGMTEEEFELQEEARGVFRAMQSAGDSKLPLSNEHAGDTEVESDGHRYDVALMEAAELKQRSKAERKRRVVRPKHESDVHMTL